MAERVSRRLVPAAVLFVVIAACFLPPAWTAGLRSRNPHAHFQKSEFCPRCHRLVDGEPDPDRLVGNADDFCLNCHRREELGRSHPRNVRPMDKSSRKPVPEEFRLDDDGRIICLTCHKGHGEFLSTVKAFPGQKPERSVSSGNSPEYKTYFIRRSDPVHGFSPLCNGCHPSL